MTAAQRILADALTLKRSAVMNLYLFNTLE
jgi:hypothetical protein